MKIDNSSDEKRTNFVVISTSHALSSPLEVWAQKPKYLHPKIEQKSAFSFGKASEMGQSRRVSFFVAIFICFLLVNQPVNYPNATRLTFQILDGTVVLYACLIWPRKEKDSDEVDPLFVTGVVTFVACFTLPFVLVVGFMVYWRLNANKWINNDPLFRCSCFAVRKRILMKIQAVAGHLLGFTLTSGLGSEEWQLTEGDQLKRGSLVYKEFK